MGKANCDTGGISHDGINSNVTIEYKAMIMCAMIINSSELPCLLRKDLENK